MERCFVYKSNGRMRIIFSYIVRWFGVVVFGFLACLVSGNALFCDRGVIMLEGTFW